MSAAQTAPAPTLLFELVGSTYIVVHSQEPPSNEEWSQHAAFVEQNAARIKGVLTFTQGAGPNALQRFTSAKIFQKNRFPAAVISSSFMVRSIVTTFNWLGVNGRAFSPHAVEAALDFLNVPVAERPDVLARAAALNQAI